ncbi:BTB/POZ protein [Rhizophagus irregularis DAOM 181602=DAOM 197198]|nr:BTB/POZ protein [Rhizophagus irregularis DAOM 181602=DAOM 197198]
MDDKLLQKLSQNLLEILNFSNNFKIYLWGKLSLEEYDPLVIIKILVAASELSLQELVDYIQSFLTKNKADWMEENFNLIYQTSFEKDSFLELQNYCTNLISNNPNKIFKSLDFSTIPENLLVSLIQSDNLQMNEIQVWENVLKWGFTQNPDFPSNLSNFSKDDFNSPKNTLQKCIPYVRFYNLTSREFFRNVVPYKKILPKELYMDLLKTYLDPDDEPNDKPKPRKGINNIENQKNFTTSDGTGSDVWIKDFSISDDIVVTEVGRVINIIPSEFRFIQASKSWCFYKEKFQKEVVSKKIEKRTNI